MGYIIIIIGLIGIQKYLFYLYETSEAFFFELVLSEIAALLGIIFLMIELFTTLVLPKPLIVSLLVSAPLIVWFILEEIRKTIEKIKQKNEENQKIQNRLFIIETSNTTELIYFSCIELADIYFKKGLYDNALKFYKQAESISKEHEINDNIHLSQKIQSAEKEYKIKTGEIWICPECGVENFMGNNICKNSECGYSKNFFVWVIKGFLKNKEDFKKWIFLGILIILALFIINLILILSVKLATIFPKLATLFTILTLLFLLISGIYFLIYLFQIFGD
jgi:tetratricopeptide (TPR) repeat protein